MSHLLADSKPATSVIKGTMSPLLVDLHTCYVVHTDNKRQCTVFATVMKRVTVTFPVVKLMYNFLRIAAQSREI
jgi:hypothetical protein